MPTRDSAFVAARLALSTNGRQRIFGSGALEEDRISTGFAELTHTARGERGVLVLGAAVQGDATPTSADYSLRERACRPAPGSGDPADRAPCLLVRPAEGWSVRVGGGTGYAAPSSMREEVEAIGLRNVQTSQLGAERSIGGMVDLNGHLLGAELLLTGYTSSIKDAIQLADAGDAVRSGVLRNATGITRVAGLEGAAIWRFLGDNKFLLTYGHARGTRPDAVAASLRGLAARASRYVEPSSMRGGRVSCLATSASNSATYIFGTPPHDVPCHRQRDARRRTRTPRQARGGGVSGARWALGVAAEHGPETSALGTVTWAVTLTVTGIATAHAPMVAQSTPSGWSQGVS